MTATAVDEPVDMLAVRSAELRIAACPCWPEDWSGTVSAGEPGTTRYASSTHCGRPQHVRAAVQWVEAVSGQPSAASPTAVR